MALTVIVETGLIVAGANSYVDPTGTVATDFFDSRLRSGVWTDASTEDRAQATIMATRYVDDMISWKGERVEPDQPRAWPREGIWLHGDWVDDESIPLDIQHAVLEIAIAFLTGDRVTDTGKSSGVSSIGLGNGALTLDFNQPDSQRNLSIIPQQVILSLQKYGSSIESSFRQVPVSR